MHLRRSTPLHQHNCSRFLCTLYTSRFPKGVKGFGVKPVDLCLQSRWRRKPLGWQRHGTAVALWQ